MALTQELIIQKRSGQSLSKEDIRTFLAAYNHGRIQEYQMSAFLMAVFFQGMTEEELAEWTKVMVESGELLNHGLPHCVDKHSSGGVGDKTSFIVAPLAAVCGCFVPMLSGRSLGHSGGTLDKLESIPGLKIPQTPESIVPLVKQFGLCFAGPTKNTAPLDRKLYALRDVTGTVESSDLIAASIMSKKLSESLQGLVLDVKCGDGAFMKNQEEAKSLFTKIHIIAKAHGVQLRGVMSDMNQPLGRFFGLGPEIYEVLQVFRGEGAKDLTDLSLKLASLMLLVAGIEQDETSAIASVQKALQDGSAYQKFCDIIAAQGGDITTFDKPQAYLSSKTQFVVKSQTTGFLASIHTERLGYLFAAMGGGRTKLDDAIDPTIGAELHRKIGEGVHQGEPLMTCFLSSDLDSSVMDALDRCFVIQEKACNPPPLIYEIF